jgi:DNA transformation protein and related proteins
MQVAHAIANLPNLGPKSQQMLATAGIRTFADLQALGSVAAYVKTKRSGAKVSLNLLWALEGALSGLHWQQVARDHRTSLLLALEQLERSGIAAPTFQADPFGLHWQETSAGKPR